MPMNDDWLDIVAEEALEPDSPIVDPRQPERQEKSATGRWPDQSWRENLPGGNAIRERSLPAGWARHGRTPVGDLSKSIRALR